MLAVLVAVKSKVSWVIVSGLCEKRSWLSPESLSHSLSDIRILREAVDTFGHNRESKAKKFSELKRLVTKSRQKLAAYLSAWSPTLG